MSIKKLITKTIGFMVLFLSTESFADMLEKNSMLQNYDISQIAIMLGIAVTIILIISLLLRKSKLGNKNNHSIKITSSMSINSKNKLVLVEVNKTNLLIGVGQNGLSLIHKFNNPKIAAADDEVFSEQYHEEVK